MNKIEKALKRLQREGRLVEPARPAMPRTPIPKAEKKKEVADEILHHVSQEALIDGGLLVPLESAIQVSDEFRRIKRPLITNIPKLGHGVDRHPNLIMITSALPDAGKTFCAVNLAASLSLERELNVLLIDADVAKPHISREFGLSDRQGLIDLLSDESLDVASTLVRTDLNHIQVLPAGRHHPQATELLASDRMSRVVAELSDRYSDRIVVIDSPPLLITSEAQALSNQVGQIVVVVEAGRTTQELLLETIDTLNPAKAINLILNKSRRWGGGGYYGRDAYYGAEAQRA